MRVRIILPALTLALATTAFAANPPAKTTTPAVMGTTQLDGQNAKIGQTFTIGKQSPINITLQRASFTTTRFVMGTTTIVPKADEKLLVLRFTAHNPNKQDTDLYGLKFTAVDVKDVNHVSEGTFVRADTNEPYNARLKPAQKIDVVAVIRVPATGVVPKLIVQRGDGLVLRYDLRGQATAVPAPFTDPKDTSGATALGDAPGALGKTYPVGRYDMTLESVAFSTEAMLGRTPPSGKRYVLATVVMKNLGADADSPSHYSFRSELLDADGEPVEFWLLAKGSRPEEAINRAVKPGEEYRVRLVFVAPEGVGLKSLVLREPNSHGLVFDLSAVK
ncbi:DUF4352 domain-containing protein [Deinococcus yavapaiensis]|uniref:Uncharacterized protein DUF4352 n=1 Tax=Deinococcus yavapaiensis KR-236 TaxID=694435 RepID=A0A318SEB7_9DEIO|nr:DUF4352 domain-containing protein [Deinococcus yavapaiensis]PYE55441.1 uncharacterized protein DUF4352 [Deinococcus yavapaiensis KR-236]